MVRTILTALFRIYENQHMDLGSVFNAGCSCEEVTELRHDCKKPHPDRTTYNQPIFLNYHKIKRRRRMLSRSSEKQSRLSPHQSGYAKIHDDNHDECDPETLVCSILNQYFVISETYF